MSERDSMEHRITDLVNRVLTIERNHSTVLNEIRTEFREDLAKLGDDVREMRDAMMAAKGGWRTLVALGTIIAAIASALGAFVHWLFQRS